MTPRAVGRKSETTSAAPASRHHSRRRACRPTELVEGAVLFRPTDLMTVLGLAAFLVTILTNFASADVTQPYFKISCDVDKGVAKIEAKWADVGDQPAGFPYTLDSIPGAASNVEAYPWSKGTAPPLAVCSFDSHRVVSIKAFNPSSPKQGIWLYIGSRLYGAVLFNWEPNIIIKKTSKQFFVNIERCSESKECQTELFTPPTFECDKASTIVDAAICAHNDLTSLDLELNAAYRDAMSGQSASKPLIMEEQKRWLSARSAHCIDPQRTVNWRSNPDLNPDSYKCLANMYISRINFLRKK